MRELTEDEGTLIMRDKPIFHRRTNGSFIGLGCGSSLTTFAM
jgi:hypothetical protein